VLILQRFQSVILILLLFPSLPNYSQIADTVKHASSRHQGKALTYLIAPTLLIGSGLATMNDNGLYSSQDAYNCIQRNFPDFHTSADDYLQFLPAAGVYGLNLAGVKGKNNFTDRTVIYLFSLSVAAATTSILKRSTHILRPDESDYRSFPSQHTTVAFVSATFLYEEFKDRSIWYGVAGYSIATATAMLRMLNNKHWLSDVLVGAGTGILTTETFYLVYPAVKDRLGKNTGNKKDNKLSMVPYASHNQLGIYLQYRIY